MTDRYIDPVEVARIRDIDLFTYLQTCDPDELFKVSQTEYRTRTHDSLRISNGKWYWHSRSVGGYSALDYLMTVHNMSFIQAAHHIKDMAPVITSVQVSVPPRKEKLEALVLPKRSSDSERAVDYLIGRGIDASIIRECIDRGIVYESRVFGKICVVFVGVDNNGEARYAMLRSCEGDWKGEAEGSKKRYSFRLEADRQNDAVHVFESAIDALSYAALMKMDKQDWRAENLLSLGGIYVPAKANAERKVPPAIEEYLLNNPTTEKFYLHHDSDDRGRKAAEALADVLGKAHEVFIAPPPEGKDVNDYLLNQLKQQRSHDRERVTR